MCRARVVRLSGKHLFQDPRALQLLGEGLVIPIRGDLQPEGV
jgi:hypothetical protein